MKLLQLKIKFYKIGTKQNKMIVIFDTLVNSMQFRNVFEGKVVKKNYLFYLHWIAFSKHG